MERALEHDQPIVLFRMACEHLQAERQVRPGVSVLERLVATARQTATEETWRILATGISSSTRDRFDQLLEMDDEVKITRFTWFSQQATEPLGKVIGVQIDKLRELRMIGLDPMVVADLNPNRVRHLAGLGRRMSPQALRRSDPARRYQIVAATLTETLYSLTDEILELFDTALGDADRRARFQLDNTRKEAAATANTTVRLFTRIGRIVLDDTVPDDQLRDRIIDSVAGVSFVDAVEQAERIARPESDNHIEFLASRYSRIRQYAPAVIDAFRFHGNSSTAELLAAIDILRTLNTDGARLVPPEAPTDFAPRAWRHAMTTSNNDQIDRHVWEIATLFETRAALRGANLWVEHSRRHQNPVNYLLSDLDWQHLRPTTPDETGISLDGRERIAQLDEHLTDNVSDLDGVLAAGDDRGVRIDNDRLVVPSLEAEEVDPDADTARERVEALLPSIEIADLLLDVHSWTGCLDGFTHANNSTSRTPDHDPRLLAVLVANGCNLGLADMARSSRFNENQLAGTQNWYVRHDTVEAASNTIINYQHALPMAQRWGPGTLSSSDGQRFPFTVKNPSARAMRRYYTGKGASIYTWTSDQHAQYGTRVIPTTEREATYVLDAIFDNETELDITIEEHTTDTAGYTDLVFGLFDLCGLKFSPRIRDIADQRLWRLPTTPTGTPAAGLLRHGIRPERFLDRWDDLLRVSATIRHGHNPASLLVARLQASARQNDLTKAIQEYGRVVKTISLVRYLHDEKHRRRILVQLNKGESLHALRRKIFFANLGQFTRRRPDDQDLQAQCLTLLTNAIVCWNTVYIDAALSHLAEIGGPIPDDIARRMAPNSHKHINFLGRYEFNPPSAPPAGRLRQLRT